MASGHSSPLEEQIDRWRSYIQHRQMIHSVDVAELEDHLREQIATLGDAGLANDEAFLVAVKRMGNLDALSREFAREHTERLWKQLVMSPSDGDEPERAAQKDAFVAFGLAAMAALLVKLPALFGIVFETDLSFYGRNLGFFSLPLLAGYFAWKRPLASQACRWLVIAFLSAAVLANLYPLAPGSSSAALTTLHMPILLLLLVGVAYTGRRWREVGGRMDFVRFSGEVFIYYVLIALGGGVLAGFMLMIFQAIGIDVEPYFEAWLLPCGAAGAVLVASWLADAKQSVIENMAPVLTRLFTPLFAAVLVVFLGTLFWTGQAVEIERDVLIAFDLLLVLVLGLLLYSVSARDARQPPGVFDVVQVLLVVSALLADAVALWAIAGRISEFGLSPNRVAALGLNLILLVNLAWSAVLSVRFLNGHGAFSELERWQTDYLPVYAAWALIVVVIFPPAFGFA